ncbi:MAG: tRNA (guanosine(37)-N1)-methyltransferase TrmD [Actinomycetales bacterium]
MSEPMRIDIVTIFPDYLAPLSLSLIGKAREQRLLDVVVRDLRDFTHDRHRTVDDTPYGGGAGLVMRPEPWGEVLDAVLADLADLAHRAEGGDGGDSGDRADSGDRRPVLLVPTPAGVPFSQAMARDLAGEPALVFACGRYEGIDERVLVDAERSFRVVPVSLGDYVLGGGEVAVLTIVEAVARLLPGVIGNVHSLVEESHEGGLLEYPVYTKPASWRGLDVPAVLLSGHHGEVARWRRDERLRRTARRRPDLLARVDPDRLDDRDRDVLAQEAVGGLEPDGG